MMSADQNDSEFQISDDVSQIEQLHKPRESEETKTPKQKKLKRLRRFKSSWETEFSWCRTVAENCFAAQCSFCFKTF